MKPTLQLLITEARLAGMLETMDDLHTAASDDTLNQTVTVSRTDMIDWLHELMYLAQETLSEIEAQEAETPVAMLRLVRKSEAS
jgi:hypothetical protein